MGITCNATPINGNVVYPVYVEVEQQVPGLRWGMSADVEIALEQREA